MKLDSMFGNRYTHYRRADALAPKRRLADRGIEAAVGSRSSQGMLQVINYVVYTNENGTNDLTNFRNRTTTGATVSRSAGSSHAFEP